LAGVREAGSEQDRPGASGNATVTQSGNPDPPSPEIRTAAVPAARMDDTRLCARISREQQNSNSRDNNNTAPVESIPLTRNTEPDVAAPNPAGARQQQAGDICAGNEQHEPHEPDSVEELVTEVSTALRNRGLTPIPKVLRSKLKGKSRDQAGRAMQLFDGACRRKGAGIGLFIYLLSSFEVKEQPSGPCPHCRDGGLVDPYTYCVCPAAQRLRRSHGR
jgi:hypothetical protein